MPDTTSRESIPLVESMNLLNSSTISGMDYSNTRLVQPICANAAIPITNCLGIGYWDITEPQHPDYDFNSQAPINIDPPEDHNSTRSNSPMTQVLPTNPTHYNTPTPGLTIASTSSSTRTTIIPQITVTAPIQQTTPMSASTTGTSR